MAKNSSSVIKALYDEFNIKFLVTGSSSFYIKDHFSESLAGRKRIFEMTPLDFEEFLQFKKVATKNLGKEKLKSFLPTYYDLYKKWYEEYIQFGGFPEVVLAEKPEDKIAYLLTQLRAMLPTNDVEQVSIEDAILTSALIDLYKRKTKQYGDGNGGINKQFQGAILSDFVKVLNNIEQVGSVSAKQEQIELASAMALRLQKWTGDTPYGRFIDKPTNVPTHNNRLVYYETSQLGDGELAQVGIIAIANLVYSLVERDYSRQKIIIFDECWKLFDIPSAAGFIGARCCQPHGTSF